ncbi:hypothetical protein GCM10022284_10290 [Streptomyces hundungensis]
MGGSCREWLSRWSIQHVIPEKYDSPAARLREGSRGRPPTGYDGERYETRNTAGRAINRLNSIGRWQPATPSGASPTSVPPPPRPHRFNPHLTNPDAPQ